MLTLESELREIVRRFNEARVEYALCGGMALAVHGYLRFTKDIDFLIAPESLSRAKEVASSVGFLEDTGRIPFSDSVVHRILKIEGAEHRILDLLVPKSLDTIAWTQRKWFDWNGLLMCTVSREGLIEMKRAAGREIDRIDIRHLGYQEDE